MLDSQQTGARMKRAAPHQNLQNNPEDDHSVGHYVAINHPVDRSAGKDSSQRRATQLRVGRQSSEVGNKRDPHPTRLNAARRRVAASPRRKERAMSGATTRARAKRAAGTKTPAQ